VSFQVSGMIAAQSSSPTARIGAQSALSPHESGRPRVEPVGHVLQVVAEQAA
jgi:hypothetical protein